MINKLTISTKLSWQYIALLGIGVVALFVGVSSLQDTPSASAATNFTSRFCIDIDGDDTNARANCMNGTMNVGDIVLQEIPSGPIPAGNTEQATTTLGGWVNAVAGTHTAYLCTDIYPPNLGVIDESDEGLGIDGYPGSGNCMEYVFVVNGTCGNGLDDNGDGKIDVYDNSCYIGPDYDPTLDEAPVVTLTANGDTGGTYIFSGEDVVLDWTSDAATSCSAPSWTTSNATAGTETKTAVIIATTYEITCYGPGGDDTTSVIVNIKEKPNLIEPVALTNSEGDYITVSDNDWDLDTGFYKSARLRYAITNDSGTSTKSDFSVRFTSIFGTNVIQSGTFVEYDTVNDLDAHETSAPKYQTLAVGDLLNPYPVRPGDYLIKIFADSDLPDDVDESNELDNVKLMPSPPNYIPAPDPGIYLDINPGFVRVGETADVCWNTNGATYSMICEVIGQGIVLDTFNPNTLGVSSGCLPSDPILSKSEFLLQCYEQISGHSSDPGFIPFSDTAIVETVGQVQEN